MGTAYGRHVVITFDEVTDAEMFMAALAKEGAVFFQDSEGHFKNVNVDTTRLRGLFAKPNSFCECPWSDGEKTYVRGDKYGLLVHDKCARPEGGHLQTATKNLLQPRGLTAKEVVEAADYARLSVREGTHRWPVPTSTKQT